MFLLTCRYPCICCVEYHDPRIAGQRETVCASQWIFWNGVSMSAVHRFWQRPRHRINNPPSYGAAPMIARGSVSPKGHRSVGLSCSCATGSYHTLQTRPVTYQTTGNVSPHAICLYDDRRWRYIGRGSQQSPEASDNCVRAQLPIAGHVHWFTATDIVIRCPPVPHCGCVKRLQRRLEGHSVNCPV